jgi:hypothetical protein
MFCERAKARVWRGKAAAGEKKRRPRGSKIAKGCILNRTGKLKMEIPVDTEVPDPSATKK